MTATSRRLVFFGIDPGTAATGYGIITASGNTIAWVDSGVICPSRTSDLPAKLEAIYDGLYGKIALHAPTRVCVEQAFYGKNARTALVLGLARGMALLAARKSGVEVVEFSPREIKKAVVGSGSAAKEQVSYMVHTLLHPPAGHTAVDANDALAAALCAFYHYRGSEFLAS